MCEKTLAFAVQGSHQILCVWILVQESGAFAHSANSEPQVLLMSTVPLLMSIVPLLNMVLPLVSALCCKHGIALLLVIQ